MAWPDVIEGRSCLKPSQSWARTILLEYEYGWIQNTVRTLQEYTGIEENDYPHLPYQWEGPPPRMFKYNGLLFYDRRPIIAAKKGPQGHIMNSLETHPKDGYWESQI